MYRGPPPPQGPGGQALKFTINETCERIKEEFNFLQAQYHSLKLELEKLAAEKTEMQRHYVMYYEMSYGLNVEMHKQTEIAKRLNAIIAQILPFLSQEHQQQVATAVERAKQVTMNELNAIIGQQHSGTAHLMQQIHAQQIPGSHGHGHPLPMVPHPAALAGLQPPSAAAAAAAAAGMPPTSAAGLLAISAAATGANNNASHLLGAGPGMKDGLPGGPPPPHGRDSNDKRTPNDDRQRNSFSPHAGSDRDVRDRHRSRSPANSIDEIKVNISPSPLIIHHV